MSKLKDLLENMQGSLTNCWNSLRRNETLQSSLLAWIGVMLFANWSRYLFTVISIYNSD
jgi:hypothetical protein